MFNRSAFAAPPPFTLDDLTGLSQATALVGRAVSVPAMSLELLASAGADARNETKRAPRRSPVLRLRQRLGRPAAAVAYPAVAYPAVAFPAPSSRPSSAVTAR